MDRMYKYIEDVSQMQKISDRAMTPPDIGPSER